MKVMDVVAHILKREGVGFLTGFPHNQVIDSCSAVGIPPIIARTERVAINMADGFGRMSGDEAVGVCAVQFGPGAENGFGAIAQAYADASSVLVLPGGYDSHEAGVAPNFQVVENLRSVTKAVMSVSYPDRAALMLHRVFGLLRCGKPGPVVVEIPDDLMTAEAGAVTEDYAPVRVSRSLADPSDVDTVVQAVLGAQRPVFIAGRGVLHSGACTELKALAELLHVPVMTTLAGKSAFPEDHPLSLGTGGLSRTAMVDHFLTHADLVVGLGTSFTRSHYTTSVPPGKRIIQITNDPQDVSKSYFVSHVLVGDVQAVLEQMREAARDLVKSKGDFAEAPAVAEIRSKKQAFLAKWLPRLASDEEPISPYRVIWELMEIADRTCTVLTHDSGNPRDQIVPFYEAIVPHGYIGWGKSTQLGTGLGLIMGAKLAKPDWLAVNIMGDAAFGMVGLDLETAVRCEIPTMTIVLNNGVMGGYEEHLPIATANFNAHHLGGHYTRVAEALGVVAARVERVKELAPALQRAIGHTKDGRPSLVEVMTREEPIFPTGPEAH